MMRQPLMLFLCLLPLLSGCATYEHVQRLIVEPPANLNLGKNLVDEACVGVPLPKESLPPEAIAVFAVRCGDWSQPSGFVALAAEAAVSEEASSSIQAPLWWRENLSRRMNCPEEAEAAPLFEQEKALLYPCQLNQGDWPYVALYSSIGGTAYLADGVPAALPAMEQAIGQLAGITQRLEDGAVEQALSTEKLPNKLPAKMAAKMAAGEEKYGAGDLQTFRRLMERGLYFNSRRNAVAAEQEFREALAVQAATLGEDNAATAEPMMHLALEISQQGRDAEAEALFVRAGTLLEKTGDRPSLARYLSYRALHAAYQGQWEMAQKLATEAVSLRREFDKTTQGGGAATGGLTLANIGGSRSGQELVQGLALQSALFLRAGNLPEASKALQEAKSRLAKEAAAPAFWRAELAALDAQIREAKGDAAGAQRAQQDAVSGWRAVDDKALPVATGYLALGALYNGEGTNSAALQAFQNSTALLAETGESVRLQQILPYLDALYAARETDAKAATAMFDGAQFVRDGLTARSIAMAAARLSASDAAAGSAIRDLQEAQRQRTALQDALAAHYAMEPGLRDTEKLITLQNALQELDTRIEDLGYAVQAAAPTYNKLVDTPARAERLQGLLQKDEALLQILHGESYGYGFLVKPDAVLVWRIDLGRDAVAQEVRRLRAAFTPRKDSSLRPFDVAGSLKFYQNLMGAQAAEILALKHLIVVPQGALLSLPFGTLVTELKDGKPQYLGPQVSLSLNPSVRAFADLRALTKPSAAKRAFLGLADFQPPAAAALKNAVMEDAACPEMQNLLEMMTPLPETAQEVKEISARFPAAGTTLLLREAFTEEKLRAQPLADYRVLYFATHGLLPSDLRCKAEASLVLSSPPDQAGSQSFLDAGEIQALALDADLVVLSACNTGGAGGDGRAGGESLSGLARAFFYAGARALLVSHWSVASRETVDLMTRLFSPDAADQAVGLADAMRLSQAAMLERAAADEKSAYLAHPFFWAPFTLVGDGAREMKF